MQIVETKEWTDLYGGWELMRDEQWPGTAENFRWMIDVDSAHLFAAKSDGDIIFAKSANFSNLIFHSFLWKGFYKSFKYSDKSMQINK